MNKKRFPFSEQEPEPGQLPYLPITLVYQGRSVTVSGLVDTGATVNVLPYHIGQTLGAIWEEHPIQVRLTGNLAHYEARGLIVSATVNGFEPVKLVFAWTSTNDVPVILGQINFFLEFDICVFGSQAYLEVSPSQKRT